MKSSLQKISGILRSRLALNVYFWLFLLLSAFVLNFNGEGRQYYYPAYWYLLFRTFTTVLFAALLYTNNFWLVPKYFVTGKRGRYFALMLCCSFVIAICFTLFFDLLRVYFPKIIFGDVSIPNTLRFVYSHAKWYVLLLPQTLLWLVPFLVFVFIFTIAWHMHDYDRQKKMSEEAQKKQTEAELVFLKNQINPHFLFNTLNNLYTLTLKKSDMAPDIVSKLSTILRYLLYESNIDNVSFEREKEIMLAYIDLELLRLPNKNGLRFHISADRSLNIPPLLWVPVLENIFKHGTRFIAAEYSVDYHFIITGNALSIYSKNSFKETKSNGAGGIGLVNLRKRLSLLFPGRHRVTTQTEENYFITGVQIQLD